MSELPPDAWVPVPMRWRNVKAGDVVLDPDGRLWMIDRVYLEQDGTLNVLHNAGGTSAFLAPRDPDATVPVLVSLAERDAVVALREQLDDVRVLEGRA